MQLSGGGCVHMQSDQLVANPRAWRGMATLWNNCNYGALLYSPITDQSLALLYSPITDQSLGTNIPIWTLIHRETVSEIRCDYCSQIKNGTGSNYLVVKYWSY